MQAATHIDFRLHKTTDRQSLRWTLWTTWRWRQQAAGSAAPCRPLSANLRRFWASGSPETNTCWGRMSWTPWWVHWWMSRSPQWRSWQSPSDLLTEMTRSPSARWSLVAVAGDFNPRRQQKSGKLFRVSSYCLGDYNMKIIIWSIQFWME